MTPYVLALSTSPGLALHDAARLDVEDLRLSVLAREDQTCILAHLARLSDDDRRKRFMTGITSGELKAYVDATEFSGATRMGWVDPLGELVALCEGFAFSAGSRSCMELAFSTDATWRRCAWRGDCSRRWRDGPRTWASNASNSIATAGIPA